jgi:hypothetical protein
VTVEPEAELARRMWRTLEPYHGFIYFTPRAADAYAALGLYGHDGYFASRAAPLGPVSAEVVIATFYNFHPDLVRHAVPSCWEKADPAALVSARFEAADAGLRDVLGEAVGDLDMAVAAGLASRVATEAVASGLPGRPLFAAHASLPWPEPPHLVLWHAVTLLRELRGDGHIAALVVEDLDPCEALITHGADADNEIPLAVLRSSRAWPEAAWTAAQDRLTARGLLAGDRLTDAGVALRRRVEQRTDESARSPWRVLSDDEAQRLRGLVRPWSRALVDSGVFGLR